MQYNKLRKYRAQVISLENELREHKQQASSAKNKYADWNTELQKKLKELREEKKNWISEAATLRSAEKEAKVMFAPVDCSYLAADDIIINARPCSPLKPSFSPRQLNMLLSCRHRRRRISTKSIGCTTTNARLNSISRSKSYGMVSSTSVNSSSLSSVGIKITPNLMPVESR